MIIPRPRSVIVKPFFDADMTPSGLLYIPDSAKGRSTQGVVKYAGRGVSLVSVGDYVLYSGYSGTYVEIDGEGEMISLDERLILCICGPADWASTPVPGIYFKDKNGQFFEGTYESITEVLAQHNKEKVTPSINFGHESNLKLQRENCRPSMEEIEVDTLWTDADNLNG